MLDQVHALLMGQAGDDPHQRDVTVGQLHAAPELGLGGGLALGHVIGSVAAARRWVGAVVWVEVWACGCDVRMAAWVLSKSAQRSRLCY